MTYLQWFMNLRVSISDKTPPSRPDNCARLGEILTPDFL